MPLIPLQIPKGQYRNGTEYMSQGRWRDGNLVRWHDDALRPVGGWIPRQQADTTNTDITSVGSVAGAVRGTHTWVDNDGNAHKRPSRSDAPILDRVLQICLHNDNRNRPQCVIR